MLKQGQLDCPILELRSNPGGFIDPAVNHVVAGEVGASYSRDGTRDRPCGVAPGALIDELTDVPLVVLVDHRAHSAAEIAAAILQNQGRAVVVGLRSPGNVEAVPFCDVSATDDDADPLALRPARHRAQSGKEEHAGRLDDLLHGRGHRVRAS